MARMFGDVNEKFSGLGRCCSQECGSDPFTQAYRRRGVLPATPRGIAPRIIATGVGPASRQARGVIFRDGRMRVVKRTGLGDAIMTMSSAYPWFAK